MLTAFDAAAVTFMVCMYALERRHLTFACGCALSSAYGFLAGTWPFGVVEANWTVVALNRGASANLGAHLLREPLAGGLTRHAECDPDLAPRPTIGARPCDQLTDASLAPAHGIDSLSECAQVGRIVHRYARWIELLSELRYSPDLVFGMHGLRSAHR
jgi:hypothetical protein